MAGLKIIIADDHPIVIEALKHILASKKSNWHIVGEAGDGIELLNLLKHESTDIAIVDLEMPRMKGYETISEIKRLYPNIQTVVLTGFAIEKNRKRAEEAGAFAIISKSDSLQNLIQTIEWAAKEKPGPFKKPIAPEKTCSLKNPMENLTLRERQIITLLCDGKTSKEISCLLNISQWTVNKHRSNIMEKLGIKNTIELVRYAICNNFAFLPQTE